MRNLLVTLFLFLLACNVESDSHVATNLEKEAILFAQQTYQLPEEKRDYITLRNKLEAAKNANSSLASYLLALMYQEGLGGAVDNSKSLELYKHAARLGSIDAKINLGVMYVNGAPDGVKTFSKSGMAKRLFEEAANEGNPHAQVNLAQLYRTGIVVNKDLKMMVSLLGEAAKKNHVGAQRLLALAYLYGDGIPKNEEKMMFWLCQAYRNGDDVAENLLTVGKTIAEVSNSCAQLIKKIPYNSALPRYVQKTQTVASAAQPLTNSNQPTFMSTVFEEAIRIAAVVAVVAITGYVLDEMGLVPEAPKQTRRVVQARKPIPRTKWQDPRPKSINFSNPSRGFSTGSTITSSRPFVSNSASIFNSYKQKTVMQSSCSCKCVNGIKRAICTSAFAVAPSCVGTCPVSINSHNRFVPKVPPPGTSRCEKAQVLNDSRRYELHTICY